MRNIIVSIKQGIDSGECSSVDWQVLQELSFLPVHLINQGNVGPQEVFLCVLNFDEYNL